MTWVDIGFIVIIVIFMALGARMGSLWTGACLIGGFFGAFLVEYYTLPVSEMIGGFTGARLVAGGLLFLAGVIVALIPGVILSKLSHAMLLGFFDSIAGLVTGLLSGLVAITLAMLFIFPHTPSLEKSKAWKTSRIVRPFHRFLEDLFNDSHFQKKSATDQLKDDFVKDFSPAFEKTGEAIKDSAESIVHKIKKK